MSDLQLLSKRQVLAMLSISKTTLDVWRRNRGFPAPLNLLGLNRWRPDEIEAWVRAKAGLTIDAVLPRPDASTVVHARYGQYTVISKGLPKTSKDGRSGA